MRKPGLAILFAAACLGASVCSICRSWHGRYLITHSSTTVRDALIESRQLNQNYVFPGCGVGREDAHAAEDFVDSITKSNPKLIRSFLSDRDPWVRAAAVLSLGRNKDASSVPAIYRIMVGDPVPKLRADAAGALARMNVESIQSDLGRLSMSEDKLTRTCAYFAMSKTPDKAGIVWLDSVAAGQMDINSDSDALAMPLAWAVSHRIQHPDSRKN